MSELLLPVTDTPPASAWGSDPNDPCKSNDAASWALMQSMFSTTVSALNDEDTGEAINSRIGGGSDDDGFLLLSPCVEKEEEDGATAATAATTTTTTTTSTTKTTTTIEAETEAPSANPTSPPTAPPSAKPTTPRPTAAPSKSPTTAKPTTDKPTTAAPTLAPITTEPTTTEPTTAEPTAKPTTAAPTTAAPVTTLAPSTASPTSSPEMASSTTTTSTTTSATTTSTATTTTATTTAETESPETTTAATTGAPDLAQTTAASISENDVNNDTNGNGNGNGKSFYACSKNNSGGSDESDAASASATIPSDAATAAGRLTITYDYELVTSSQLDDDILSSFENAITRDLADNYGLIACGNDDDGGGGDSGNNGGDGSGGEEPTRGRRRGRNLRKRRFGRGIRQLLEEGAAAEAEVVALDSAPADESMVDAYECSAPDNLPSSSIASTSCTPVRGYMTAYYLPNSSSSRSIDETEAQLLAYIESGMQSGAYVSDDVIKASYVGVREPVVGEDVVSGDNNGDITDGGGGGGTSGSTGSSNGQINGGNNGSGQDGNAVDNGIGNANGDSNNANNDANPDNTGTPPSLDGAKEQETPDDPSSSGPPLLAIGISLLAIAALLAIVLAMYIRRRKKRNQYFADGPDSDLLGNRGAPSSSLAAQTASAEEEVREDDVQLLPSPDKLDMRSVHSDDNSTDCETENYTYEDYKMKEKEAMSKYGCLYGGSYADADGGTAGGLGLVNTLSSKTIDYGNANNEEVEAGRDDDAITPKSGSSQGSRRMSAGSSLAAMGVASTLAARSFTPTNFSESNSDNNVGDSSSPESSSPNAPAEESMNVPSSYWPMMDSSAAPPESTEVTPGVDSEHGASTSPGETPGVSSHVGTVDDTSLASTTTSIGRGGGVGGDGVGVGVGVPWGQETTTSGISSVDSMEEGTFGSDAPMAWS